MSSSFARALSPLASIAQVSLAAAESVDESSKTLIWHTALQGATTVEDILAMVPSDYRHVLREPLLGVAATATKLHAARNTVAKWLQHQTAGTYPPHLRFKVPEVQLTKDYSKDQEAVAHQRRLLDAHKAYMDTTLLNAICAKQDDILFLELSLQPDRLYNKLQPLVSARAGEIMAKSKLPVFETDEHGVLSLSGWKDNDIAKSLVKDVLSDVVVYAFRVISIVEACELTADVKIKRKKEIAKQADEEMADGTKPGPSIQSMIDKAVSARLKKVTAASQKVRRFSPYLRTELTKTSSERQGQSQAQRQEEEVKDREERLLQQEQDPRKTGALSSKIRTSSTRRNKGRKGWQEGKSWQGQTEEVGWEVILTRNPDHTFRYDLPSTYLDWLLTIPFTHVVKYVIYNTPVNIITAS